MFCYKYHLYHIQYISFGVIASPISSILIAIFVILGIKNKNYSYYNCAQITCIVFSVLESLFFAIILIVSLVSDDYIKRIQKELNDKTKYDAGTIRVTLFIVLSIIIAFIWLESCVLIRYNKRVKNHCEGITVRNINNMINQPLV